MDTGYKSPFFSFGIFFMLVGFYTISEPKYYFRGGYVDFTGYNVPVGWSLMIIGIVFMGFSFHKSKFK